MPRRRHSSLRPIVIVLLITLAVAALASYVPLKQHLESGRFKEVLQKIEARAEIVHTLQFDVRDSSGAIMPDVTYRIGKFWMADEEPILAAGDYAHTLPPGTLEARYSIETAEGNSVMWTLDLRDRSEPIVPVPVQWKFGPPLTGRVIDESGAPVANARIELYAYPENRETTNRVSYTGKETTDTDGRWRFNDVPESCTRTNLRVMHEDFASDLQFDYDSPATPGQEHVKVLSRDTPFGGAVTDESGAPLQGVALSISRSEEASTVSDEAGHFVFPNCVEDYFENQVFTIRLAGYATRYQILNKADWRTDHEVVLTRAKPFSVRILDDAQEPMRNTDIWISINTSPQRQVDYLTKTTDADGVIRIEDAPENIVWNFSTTYGEFGSVASARNLELNPAPTPHAVQLESGPRVILIAEDAATGASIAPITVMPGSVRLDSGKWWVQRFMNWRRIAGSTYWRGNTKTEPSGVFIDEFEHDDHQGFQYRVFADGYQSTETRIVSSADDTAYLRVKMTPGKSLRLRAVNTDGTPDSGARAFWMERNHRFTIRDGDVPRDNPQLVIEANESGWLNMPPADPAKHVIGILGTHGGLLADPAPHQTGQEIKLAPWATLAITLPEAVLTDAQHGIRMGQTQHIAGVDMTFDITVEKPESGVFTAAQLFPGTYWVGPVYGRNDRPNAAGPVPWTTLEIQAGVNAHTTLDGGRVVTAQLEMPDQAWEWHRTNPATIYFTRQDPPKEFRISHSYIYFKSTPDGKAATPPLPPGNYLIDFAAIQDPARAPDDYSIPYLLQDVRFTVPDEPDRDDVPVDIGTLTFRAQ